MPRKKTQRVQKAIYPSPGIELKPFSPGVQTVKGLNLYNGVDLEELHRDLHWPMSAKTYKKMTYSVPVNASLNFYSNLIAKAQWRVKPCQGATKKEKKQATIVEQMLHDMDRPFSQVLRDALSSNIYGFACLEKVFRKRTKANGSMYDDGLEGLADLPLIMQETIDGFVMSDDNSTVLGVQQNLSRVRNASNVNMFYAGMPAWAIRREKFALFRAGSSRGSPYGVSLLRDAYMAWRYLEVLAEMEAEGCQRDLNGVPIFEVPPSYLSPDADDDVKAALQTFENMMANIQNGSEGSAIIPRQFDPETRNNLFNLRLLSVEGGKRNFDLDKIKRYYETQVYLALGADVLLMGNTNTGSFALASIKTSIAGSYAEAMLDNIVEVFNREVIRHIYERNGWDVSRACTLDYENLNSVDMDTFSKFIQRVGAVGFLPKTEDVVNRIMTSIGLDHLEEGTDLSSILSDNTSRSADGMKSGMGSGTGDAISSEDGSVANTENT